jgi:FKBP-type peptidyl-prolyl cis-trans isomerase FkpA
LAGFLRVPQAWRSIFEFSLSLDIRISSFGLSSQEYLMAAIFQRFPAIFLSAGLAAIIGCNGSNDGSKDASPIPRAPALAGPGDAKPKAAELPERPQGAGEYDADAPLELTPTGSGLYYRILRRGDGKKPTATSNVVAHYKGWLENGTQFDSSYDRREPTPFPLNGVIKGWTEGLQLIGAGGMIELEIPAELAYGVQGRPGIPPGATLHFIVELYSVK